MVSKMEKDTVIILYKKGLSIRKIAADTILAMNTVKKYISEYLATESKLSSAKSPIGQDRIHRQMTEAPKFNALARKTAWSPAKRGSYHANWSYSSNWGTSPSTKRASNCSSTFCRTEARGRQRCSRRTCHSTNGCLCSRIR